MSAFYGRITVNRRSSAARSSPISRPIRRSALRAVIGFEICPLSGVGPWGRTVSGGRFDRLAGLFLLEAIGAQVAEGRV